jgi:chitin disaccharide deacetylase
MEIEATMFPAKYVIITADDFNLTRGTERGILECFDNGPVKSTSVFMTLPVSSSVVKKLKKRTFLGKGLHLSLTHGESVSRRTQRRFKKQPFHILKALPVRPIQEEFEAQILKFFKVFKHLPAHLDTHHHIHVFPNVYKAVLALAEKHKIPFRRVNQCTKLLCHNLSRRKIFLTQDLYMDMTPKDHWTEKKLIRYLKHLRPGITEIMVHPGYADKKLKAISGFCKEREYERKALLSSRVKNLMSQENIKNINFSDLKYFGPLFY